MPSEKRVAQARRDEFEALYGRHGREVWALAYARWLDADLARDVVQEAFLRLWRALEAGEDIQNARAWLLRVARNLAEDLAKSSFRRNGTHPPEVMNAVLGGGDSPLDGMERAELFAQIRAGLAGLSEADRELLSLRYALDYDPPAIAEVLGVHVSAVHMRLTRARQRLADKLTALGVAPK